jgi:hypothetical protein
MTTITTSNIIYVLFGKTKEMKIFEMICEDDKSAYHSISKTIMLKCCSGKSDEKLFSISKAKMGN